MLSTTAICMEITFFRHFSRFCFEMIWILIQTLDSKDQLNPCHSQTIVKPYSHSKSSHFKTAEYATEKKSWKKATMPTFIHSLWWCLTEPFFQSSLAHTKKNERNQFETLAETGDICQHLLLVRMWQVRQHSSLAARRQEQQKKIWC